MLSLGLHQVSFSPAPPPTLAALQSDPEVLQCRREIDRADQMILDALEHRARSVAHLAGLKRRAGAPVLDASREQDVLERAAAAPHTLPGDRRRSIFATIIAQMRDWQSTLP